MPLKRDADKKSAPRQVFPEIGCRLSVGSAINEESVETVTKQDRSPSKGKKIKPTFRFPKKDIFPKSKEKEEKKEKEGRKSDEKKKEDKEERKKEKHKLKEKKKSKHRESAVSGGIKAGVPDKPVFSVALSVAVDRSKCHDGIELPAIFRECIDYIEEHGLNCEGIYRISGVKSKVQQLKECYNKGLPAYLYEHEPNVVASLLKQFLRELPEPVLTTSLMAKFEEASTLKTDAKRLEAFRKLLEELPLCNRLLLSWMIVHMTHIIEHQAQNKMSLQNVSIVLSPTMQISHRVLNVFFSLATKLFGDTQIKKYVPPLRPATSRWSLELPDNPAALEEELHKQESLLNALHEEIKMGVEDPSKEEQLWEVQRVVTQLKRKIKFAHKATDAADRRKKELESKKPKVVSELDELNLELQPVAEGKEDRVKEAAKSQPEQESQEKEIIKKVEPAKDVSTKCLKVKRFLTKLLKVKRFLTKLLKVKRFLTKPLKVKKFLIKLLKVKKFLTKLQKVQRFLQLLRLQSSTNQLLWLQAEYALVSLRRRPLKSNVWNPLWPKRLKPTEVVKNSGPETRRVTTATPAATTATPATIITATTTVADITTKSQVKTAVKEQPQPVPVLKPTGPIKPHLQISQQPLQPINVCPQSRSSTLEGSDSFDQDKMATDTDVKKVASTSEEPVQDEETKKLLEEEYAMTLEEEELLAIGDELKQKIETEQSEIERLKQEIVELQYLRQDSDLEDYSSTSESSDESEDEEELTELLNSLIAENEELEKKNSELCQKIHDERMACLDCKVSIRLIQQKQLDSDNILDRDNPI
ncbi:ralA-binding protein 1-like [Liolophura sinensis]|uniref:ralA-binding protein 1-like n=1 Tax=Liolophura sinensis TaxID=3198878 RepID=UPI0031592D64